MTHALFIIIYITSMLTMSAGICWILLKGSRGTQTYSFLACQGLIVLWIAGEILQLLSVNVTQFWGSYLISNVSICLIPPFWMIFSFRYCDKKPNMLLKVMLFVFSSVMYLSVATNPIHMLYYSRFEMEDVVHGPIFYINQLYMYVCMVVGMVFICTYSFKKRYQSPEQTLMITLSAAIPLVLNLLTLTGILKLSLQVIPLSFALTSMLILVATYKYGFLDVNAVVLEEVFDHINEGVIAFSKAGKLTYVSRAAQQLLDIHKGMNYDAFIEYASSYSKHGFGGNFEYEEIARDGKIISLKCYRIYDDRDDLIAFAVVVSNISRYYELIESNNELRRTEQSLAIEKERNRIAGEVHDTVGHTFTMISSLSRLCTNALDKIETKSDKSVLDKYIKETGLLARGGITQLRCSINNLRDGVFLKSCTAAIKTVADAVRDMETEIFVQGEEAPRYTFAAKTIYEVCRELVTNATRYSGAERMDFILKLLDDRLELYVFDNGCGCAEINPHNGLGGIEEKISALSGEVRFSSIEGSGFSTFITIPVDNDKER